MASLSDLSLSTTDFAAGTVAGAVLSAINGVSAAIETTYAPSADFSDERNSDLLA